MNNKTFFANNISNYIKSILKFYEFFYIRLKFLQFLRKIVIITINKFFRLLFIIKIFVFLNRFNNIDKFKNIFNY